MWRKRCVLFSKVKLQNEKCQMCVRQNCGAQSNQGELHSDLNSAVYPITNSFPPHLLQIEQAMRCPCL